MAKRRFKRVWKITEEQKVQAKALAEEGKSANEIARVINLSPASVRNLARKEGLILKRTRKTKKRKLNSEQKPRQDYDSRPWTAKDESSDFVEQVFGLLAAYESKAISQVTMKSILVKLME